MKEFFSSPKIKIFLSVLLVLIAALCGAGLYFGVQNMPVGEAEPTGTPAAGLFVCER